MKDEFYTPPEIFKALGPFDLDPACGPLCPNRAHAKKVFESNGLDQEWKGRVWLNPPFSNLHPWVTKFREHGNGIVLLVAHGFKNQWCLNLIKQAGGYFQFQKQPVFLRPDGSTIGVSYNLVLVGLGGENIEAIKQSGLNGFYLQVI